jgi:hypothetical protein
MNMKKIIGLIIVMGLFTITYGQERTKPEIRTLFGNDGKHRMAAMEPSLFRMHRLTARMPLWPVLKVAG